MTRELYQEMHRKINICPTLTTPFKMVRFILSCSLSLRRRMPSPNWPETPAKGNRKKREYMLTYIIVSTAVGGRWIFLTSCRFSIPFRQVRRNSRNAIKCEQQLEQTKTLHLYNQSFAQYSTLASSQESVHTKRNTQQNHSLPVVIIIVRRRRCCSSVRCTGHSRIIK